MNIIDLSMTTPGLASHIFQLPICNFKDIIELM